MIMRRKKAEETKKPAKEKPAAKKASAEKTTARKADKAEAKETKKPAKAEAKPAAKKEKKEKKFTVSADAAKEGIYHVILRPVITEKSTAALEHNKVLFKVHPDASKPEIKQAVEQLFGVTVLGVNTVSIKGKAKRFKGTLGRRGNVKKAIVTLKQGDTIDFAAGVK